MDCRPDGEKQGLLLVPLSDSHLPRRAEFANDPGLRRMLGIPVDAPQETPDSERPWLGTRLAAGDVLLAIEVDGEYVGDIDIFFVPQRRSAEFTLVIGDARFRGKGVGTEVVQRVLRWLFSGGLLSLEPSSDEAPTNRAGFPAAYVEVDTEPGRNPLAHRFWLRQGFRFHHFEGELHWLRLTREDWLVSPGSVRPADPASIG